MASEHANAQIRLIKGLIKEAIEEEYSILLERPERRSNLIENEDVIEEFSKQSSRLADQAAVNLF